MKQATLFAIIFLSALSACNSKNEADITAEKEVGTTFIRKILDNNFVEAKPFVLQDAENLEDFEDLKSLFGKLPKEKLDGFKAANIVIDSIVPKGDSVSIFHYKNSFEKDNQQKLKLVWSNGKWLVDLKYSVQ